MDYELQNMPFGEDGRPTIDGFNVAKNIVLLTRGGINKLFQHIGKGLDRSVDYAEMSEDTQSFIREITYHLLLEQLVSIFDNEVKLSNSKKHKAHTQATAEIEGCDTLVKMLNNMSKDDVRTAVIARTKEDAIKILLQQLQEESDQPGVSPSMPIDWESLQISDPFNTNKE
mgnify:CR=1 FL=1